MDPQAFLEGYLSKEAGSVSDDIVAKYGTKKFRKGYQTARKKGATSQQAARKAIQTPTPTPAPTPTPTPTPRLAAAARSSKKTFDAISNPESKARFSRQLQNIYKKKNIAAPAWVDPVKAMSKEDKLQEFKTLGQEHAKTLTDPAARSEFVQSTLSNIDRQGLTHTPEWMYDAMRKGQLDASTEALLKHRYMQTPEYQANWQRGQDLFDQKMREFNSPDVPAPAPKEVIPPEQIPSTKNLFAGDY